MAERAPQTAIVTVSSSRANGGDADRSGEALAALARAFGAEVVARETVADERAAIEALLRRLADGRRCDLILTTGGTGLAASDVTPEATEAVLEKRAPGIAEALRAASAPHTENWMLSRGTAGTRGASLIVNFPGSPRSIEQTGPALAPALGHAVALLRGDHPGGHG